MKKEVFIKVGFLVLLLALLVLVFVVTKPFLTALVAAAVLAYIFRPFYKRLYKATKMPNISALIVSATIVLFMVITVVFVITSAGDQAKVVYTHAMRMLERGTLLESGCAPVNSSLCSLLQGIDQQLQDPVIKDYVKEGVKRFTLRLTENVASFILSLPAFVMNVAVVFFTAFYLMRDWPSVAEKLKSLIPVKKRHQEHIIAQLRETTFALIYGSLMVAIVQGVAGGLGLWLAGIGSPVLWGAVIAVFALVPVLGTGLVWGPAGMWLIITGATTGSTVEAVRGIALLIYGAVVVASIDNVLRPTLIGKRARIHPILVLVGVLGGLTTFGIVGFVLGPLILAMLQSFIKIYEQEFRHL